MTETELFRIKPLEWKWFERPACAGSPHKMQGYQAKSGWYYANVYRTELADGGWSGWRWYSKIDSSQICPSLEEGKQLAEAHWQEYIKQALIPVETSQ